MKQATQVAWYRFTTTFGRRRGGYLAVVLLIGLVGGIAMASIAGGRRTQASYPTFLASTNSADLTLTVYNASGSAAAAASLTTSIARLPDVKRVESLFSPTVVPLASNGAPQLSALNAVSIVGSADGMFLDEDRVVAVDGPLLHAPRDAGHGFLMAGIGMQHGRGELFGKGHTRQAPVRAQSVDGHSFVSLSLLASSPSEVSESWE